MRRQKQNNQELNNKIQDLAISSVQADQLTQKPLYIKQQQCKQQSRIIHKNSNRQNHSPKITQSSFYNSKRIDPAQTISPYRQNTCQQQHQTLPQKNMRIQNIVKIPRISGRSKYCDEQDILSVLKVPKASLFQIFCDGRKRQNGQKYVVHQIQNNDYFRKIATCELLNNSFYYLQQNVKLQMPYSVTNGIYSYILKCKKVDQTKIEDSFIQEQIASFKHSKVHSPSMIRQKIRAKSMKIAHSKFSFDKRQFKSRCVQFSAEKRIAYFSSKLIKMNETTPHPVNTIIQDQFGNQQVVIFYRRQRTYLACINPQLPTFVIMCLAISRMDCLHLLSHD